MHKSTKRIWLFAISVSLASLASAVLLNWLGHKELTTLSTTIFSILAFVITFQLAKNGSPFRW